MSGHTPGPWVANARLSGSENHKGYSVQSPGFYCIGEMYPIDADGAEGGANARLISAAPELLQAQTMGAGINTPDFLEWVAMRLINVYREAPHTDFVQSLFSRAAVGRAAIAKATGETK